MPLISILTTVFNTQEDFLNKSIDSILKQSHQNFEYIIINDGSNEVTRNLLQKWANLDSRIILKDLPKNIGLTKALNVALTLANGVYIARQDADDISEKTRLEEQVKYLELNQDIYAVCSDVILINKDNIKIGLMTIDPELKELTKRNILVHGAMMFRKKIFDRLGGYNEKMFLSQDYELYLRMIYKGQMNIGVISKNHYYLRKHLNSLSSRYLIKQLYYAVLAKIICKSNHKNMVRWFYIYYMFTKDLIFVHKLFISELIIKLKSKK